MTSHKLMKRLERGSIAGFVATAPMTAAMEGYRRTIPATRRDSFIPRQVAEGISRRLGIEKQVDAFGEPGWWLWTAITHFGFGAAAGGLFGLVEPALRPHHDNAAKQQQHKVSIDVAQTALTGTVFGLLIWATHYLLLFPILGLIKPHGLHPIRKNGGLIFSHLVWGITTALMFDSLRQKPSQPARGDAQPSMRGVNPAPKF